MLVGEALDGLLEGDITMSTGPTLEEQEDLSQTIEKETSSVLLS